MREIAIGLEPAHAMDILHRDLKPDNILIDTAGRSWIADFGLAISEDEQVHHRRELAGTPPYMSPEQIQGKIDFLDPRSDVWALGVMFYELLTGKLPFNGKNRKAIAEQICEMDPRPLHQRAPGLLTESMNEVFLRCCAKKPSDRYATVAKFVEALDQLAHDGLCEQNLQGQTVLSVAELIEGAGPLLPRRSAIESARAIGSLQASERTERATARTAASTVQDASPSRSLDWRWLSALIGLIGIGVVAYPLLFRPELRTTVAEESTELPSTPDRVTGASPRPNPLGDGSKEKP
jgi:serine/threonine protein kinase